METGGASLGEQLGKTSRLLTAEAVPGRLEFAQQAARRRQGHLLGVVPNLHVMWGRGPRHCPQRDGAGGGFPILRGLPVQQELANFSCTVDNQLHVCEPWTVWTFCT